MICSILKCNSSSKLCAIYTCNSNLVSSFVNTGEDKIRAKDIGWEEDCFLFCWAKNLFTIDWVREADFFNSFLRLISRFSVNGELNPLTL